ncbi:ribonucleoside-diphosphate reductase subunit alpha [Rickettsia asembonensis]|uniref:Ribonucleoside-diphosphate reductase n=1 Tax=Rickettsia asembonensis TaxID=1068590 RepID=A0A0C2QYG1_9RICK|nr:ribonucleoside-diphosphate reductase subunit alpha [Rickettsia asembonensis]KIJ88889.1 ribonucleotide-diphosphate reductase subunit alpha [Rickettsia asembonensis]
MNTLKKNKFQITINNNHNNLLTPFGKAILRDRYLMKGEDFQYLFARVSSYYAENKQHAQKLYEYMSKMWFMPATPILSNGGTDRGLPISCFLNETDDSLDDIVNLWTENVWLAARGGGIGSYWGNVRSINEVIRDKGHSSGIIPFIKVMDSMTLAISQGSIRRGSSAVYLPINHPEIEEFIDIRRSTGGDVNRKALNIHHGIAITDEFMKAVENNTDFDLVSPATKKVVNKVRARDLWVKLLTTRIETGEPYLLFIDSVNKSIPEHHKKLGLQVKMSNLCSEITLPTGIDHLGKSRTAVCCLSSLNLEYYEEWKDDKEFIHSIMLFLDNVLEDFINKAPDTMARAKYSAMRERSVGLGVMGFHSFLQMKKVPIESVMAKVWNKKIFEYISAEADKASIEIGKEKGVCPDAIDAGSNERFSNKTAIAPTASISVIAGNASPGIEPFAANSFVQKTLTGSFNVRNKHLEKLLEEKGFNNDQVWSSIATHEGSVQHLTFLSKEEKQVFKTAYEIDQNWLIELASDRTPYITQAQSLNIFLPGNVSKKYLNNIHFKAWKKGVKSLYYCRSTSIQRADKVSHDVLKADFKDLEKQNDKLAEAGNYEECLACQ